MMMLVVVVLAAGSLLAQEVKVVEKVSKKELKKEKKAQRKIEYELFKAEGLNSIEDRDFVLMADRISGRSFRPVLVMDNLNFIKIEGEEITVQYALDGRIGVNGLGGVTYRGKIRNIEAKDLGQGKPGNVLVEFVAPYARGMVRLYIDIRGDQATAQLLNNGQMINFRGEHLTTESADVTRGISRAVF